MSAFCKWGFIVIAALAWCGFWASIDVKLPFVFNVLYGVALFIVGDKLGDYVQGRRRLR